MNRQPDNEPDRSKPTPWLTNPERDVMVVRDRGRVAALHDWAQLWLISQITYWQAGSRVS